jgi:hypothetical protein
MTNGEHYSNREYRAYLITGNFLNEVAGSRLGNRSHNACCFPLPMSKGACMSRGFTDFTALGTPMLGKVP